MKHKTWKQRNTCIECNENTRPHFGGGRCRLCYMRRYNRKNAERIAAQKDRWYRRFVAGTNRQKITRDKLHFGGQRERVLQRDGYKCVRCGSVKSLIVHHKDRTGRGKSHHNNSDKNLETLCRKCHVNEHREELTEAREAKKGTTCKRGHERISENGRHDGKQWRCRLCANMLAALYREGKRVKQ